MRVVGELRIRLAAAVVAVICCAGIATPARAETGQVRMRIQKVGFIFGVGGGLGLLTLHGHHHALTVRGVRFGATLGAPQYDLVGRAYHLTHASDIAGSYAAAGPGAGIARLQNARGVVIELQSNRVGTDAAVAISALEILMH